MPYPKKFYIVRLLADDRIICCGSKTECAKKLGISESGLHRLARLHGLKKTKQFMRKTQRATSDAAKASHHKNGTYPPKGYKIPRSDEYQCKKGETPVQRISKLKNLFRKKER